MVRAVFLCKACRQPVVCQKARIIAVGVLAAKVGYVPHSRPWREPQRRSFLRPHCKKAMSALGRHQQLITLVCAQFCCGHAAALPHGGLEPKVLDAALLTDVRFRSKLIPDSQQAYAAFASLCSWQSRSRSSSPSSTCSRVQNPVLPRASW